MNKEIQTEGPSFTTYSRVNKEGKWETYRINRKVKFHIELYEVDSPITQQRIGRNNSFTVIAESADDAYEKSKIVCDNMFIAATNIVEPNYTGDLDALNL
jgi:hypothetical protein